MKLRLKVSILFSFDYFPILVIVSIFIEHSQEIKGVGDIWHDVESCRSKCKSMLAKAQPIHLDEIIQTFNDFAD